MILREFSGFQSLADEAVRMLVEQFQMRLPYPHAVMLPGGRTPLPLYRQICASSVTPDASLRLMLSDERLCPFESSESNYGMIRSQLAELNIPDDRFLHVDPALPADSAASAYHQQLAEFMWAGGVVTLGLLGLGADGHTASLFSADDVQRGRGAFAVAVERADGMHGVSVTPNLLHRVRRIVVIAAGPDKRDVVHRLISTPVAITAGLALAGTGSVEVWYSATAAE